MHSVIVDTNLLVLLVVGLADIEIVSSGAHDNLSGYTVADYLNLADFLTAFSDIVLLPHILAEVSNLSRQIRNPYRTAIQIKLRDFVALNGEVPLLSIEAVRRPQFLRLGITDAAILHALDLLNARTKCALFTVDGDLAIEAQMSGHDVYTIEALRG